MSVAIRYQSRGGHVKEMAEIIAEGAKVEPVSINDPEGPITKPVDVLFIGGALYKFHLDPSMEEYLKNIPEGMVRKAIVLGTHAASHLPDSGAAQGKGHRHPSHGALHARQAEALPSRDRATVGCQGGTQNREGDCRWHVW